MKQMTTNSGDRLLNKREAAELLRISGKTLDRLRAAKRLQPVRIGRACRWRLSTLERFIAALAAECEEA